MYYPYNDNLKDFLLENNDIVMCMTGGTVGKTLLINNLQESMLVNQRVADIKINSQISNVYVYNFLKSYFIKKTVKGNKNSTNDNISMDLIKSFLFPLPPYNEQLQIVNKIMDFEILIAEYDKLEQQSTKLDSEIKDKLKKSILQYAIQGKLVEQDPNDEPASVLLEKIRAEKKAKLGKKYVDSYIYKGDDNCYYEKNSGKVVNITEEIVNTAIKIPDSWSWSRLGNVINLLSGRDLSSNDYSNTNQSGVPYITGASNFYNGSLIVNRWTNHQVVISKFGDLLITCKGTIGEMAYNTIGDLHIARQVMSINSSIEIKYVEVFLKSYLNILISKAKSMIPGISRDDICNSLIPIPPHNEQIKICNQLEEILNKI